MAVLASGDEHLLPCFVLGSEGSQVSLAVIVPEAIVALDAAVRDGDLAAAQAAHEIIYPLAKAIYGTAPRGLATARLKACFVLGSEGSQVSLAVIVPEAIVALAATLGLFGLYRTVALSLAYAERRNNFSDLRPVSLVDAKRRYIDNDSALFH